VEENKEDRRVRRTRRLLKQGLAELMQEKEFKNITVKDITDRMDLNRGTFYLHYRDTYDLLEKMENEVLEELQSLIDTYVEPGTPQSLHSVLNPVMDYIVENRKLCRAIFENQACGDFIGKFRDLMYRNGKLLIRQQMTAAQKKRYDLAFGFISYGVMGTVQHWFDSDMDLSEEEVVEILYLSITGTLEQVLRGNIYK
jgi:AcrR family transcriptional regulator